MPSCSHIQLSFDVVDSARFNYRPPSDENLLDALRVGGPPRKKVKKPARPRIGQGALSTQERQHQLPLLSTFPAPVVLPGDELFRDADYPRQSVQEWTDEEARNAVTNRRKTIYVVPPPAISDEVNVINEWHAPLIKGPSNSKKEAQQTGSEEQIHPPKTEDVLDYLQAFYHGMTVKFFDKSTLEFIAWEDGKGAKKTQVSDSTAGDVPYIGLSTGREAVRLRCRPSKDGIFRGQINLNDVLDAAMPMLPSDAYAMIMLMHQDLYEDEDDDFCCGRAYGGSRVAVVSTARYRPELDEKQKVDLEHSWPASHCMQYTSRFYSAKTLYTPPEKRDCKTAAEWHPDSAIAAAVMASNALPMPTSVSELSALWLGRVGKTASHELGHCFGIDHCVYRACIMQATARMAEDVRQPPYLCPVDLSKVLRATGADEKERYRALLGVCQKYKQDRMFAAFGAWLEARLSQPNAFLFER